MGNWHISIFGHGQHHNGQAADVDARLTKFLRQLEEFGHTIGQAVLTVGSTSEVIPLLENAAENAIAGVETAVGQAAEIAPGSVVAAAERAAREKQTAIPPQGGATDTGGTVPSEQPTQLTTDGDGVPVAAAPASQPTPVQAAP